MLVKDQLPRIFQANLARLFERVVQPAMEALPVHSSLESCQSASKRDPLSACNRDPLLRFGMDVTSAPLARVGA